MRSFVALVLLAVGWSGAARAEKGPGLENLKDLDQVSTACLAARPLARVYLGDDAASQAKAREEVQAARTETFNTIYSLHFPAESISFGDYHRRHGQLDLDLSKPMATMHGAVTVSFSDSESVAFDLSHDQYEAVQKAERSGAVSLVAYFQLDDTSDGTCGGSTAAQLFTIHALPAVFELRGANGERLSRVELSRADQFRSVLGGYRGTPEAIFGAIDADGADTNTFARGLSTVSDALRHCYAERLKTRNDAGGTVVVGLSVNVKGAVESVSFIADALGDDTLRQCIDDQLHHLDFAGAGGLPALVRVPIEFKLIAQR